MSEHEIVFLCSSCTFLPSFDTFNMRSAQGCSDDGFLESICDEQCDICTDRKEIDDREPE